MFIDKNLNLLNEEQKKLIKYRTEEQGYTWVPLDYRWREP